MGQPMEFLRHLKEATRPYHDRIEAGIDFLRPDFTLQEYARLLRRLYGYYGPVEACLAAHPWEAVGLDFPRRRKLPRLETDLRALGDALADLDRLPRCSRLPPLHTLSGAFGCLYVLEGATLGGQVITRHLRHGLAWEAPGGAFFGSYGQEVGSMWQEFRQCLARHADDPVRQDRVVDAARKTFTTLEDWLRAGRLLR
jgi:heme oxygenase (biliverdin-IX-beta and delta-forming)